MRACTGFFCLRPFSGSCGHGGDRGFINRMIITQWLLAFLDCCISLRQFHLPEGKLNKVMVCGVGREGVVGMVNTLGAGRSVDRVPVRGEIFRTRPERWSCKQWRINVTWRTDEVCAIPVVRDVSICGMGYAVDRRLVSLLVGRSWHVWFTHQKTLCAFVFTCVPNCQLARSYRCAPMMLRIQRGPQMTEFLTTRTSFYAFLIQSIS